MCLSSFSWKLTAPSYLAVLFGMSPGSECSLTQVWGVQAEGKGVVSEAEIDTGLSPHCRLGLQLASNQSPRILTTQLTSKAVESVSSMQASRLSPSLLYQALPQSSPFL